jgi:hypothetical protein
MMIAGSCLSSYFVVGQKRVKSALHAPFADNFNVSSTHCPAKLCRETDSSLPPRGAGSPAFGETDMSLQHVGKTCLKKRRFPP